MARLGGMDPKEVRSILQGNHHPDIVRCIAGISERQDHLFQLLGQLAHSLDVLANSILAQTSAVEALRTEHEAIRQAKAGGVKVASEAANEE